MVPQPQFGSQPQVWVVFSQTINQDQDGGAK